MIYKLEEILTIVNGKNQKKVENPEGKYPIYGSGGIMGYADQYLCEANAVVIGRKGSINNPLFVDEPFWNVDTAFGLIANDMIIQPKFLFYFCKQFNFEKLNTTVTIPSLTKARLSKIEIDVPDIDIQLLVIDVLDKINELINLYKKQLDKLDLIVKSRFVETFGNLNVNERHWRIARFKEFALIDTKMINDFEKYADYPHIGIDSIEKVTGKLQGYKSVKEDGVISGKYLFTSEHIIYSKIRPNLNKVALPNFEGLCSADAYPILPKKDFCNREFFGYAMRSDIFLNYILAFSSRTNLPKVNKKQVEGFEMPLPPINLQNKFSTFVQKVDKSKLEVQKALEKTEILYKALMQQYFN